jgi:hypothetical protein
MQGCPAGAGLWVGLFFYREVAPLAQNYNCLTSGIVDRWTVAEKKQLPLTAGE